MSSPPDIEQLSRVRKFTQFLTPLASLMDRLSAHNLPPQLVQVTFWLKVTADNAPALLIPKNPRRQSFAISLVSTTVPFGGSYGNPISLAIGLPGGLSFGSPQVWQESNGSVSINDLYVWTINSGAVFPQYFIGYEGLLAPSGNPR